MIDHGKESRTLEIKSSKLMGHKPTNVWRDEDNNAHENI